MRAFCHACNKTFRVSQGGRIRCPRCARVINLGAFDHFFDGPQESAYFGWSEDAPQRRLALDDSTVAQAVATVGNAAFRLFRSVVQRLARPPGRRVEPPGTDDSSEVAQEQKQQQEHDHYTDDLRLN